MQEGEGRRNRENRAIYRVTKFSRRQFLKRVSVTVGGAAIASISFASACKSPGSITTGNDYGCYYFSAGNIKHSRFVLNSADFNRSTFKLHYADIGYDLPNLDHTNFEHSRYYWFFVHAAHYITSAYQCPQYRM